jgi:hypothetical protein
MKSRLGTSTGSTAAAQITGLRDIWYRKEGGCFVNFRWTAETNNYLEIPETCSRALKAETLQYHLEMMKGVGPKAMPSEEGAGGLEIWVPWRDTRLAISHHTLKQWRLGE